MLIASAGDAAVLGTTPPRFPSETWILAATGTLDGTVQDVNLELVAEPVPKPPEIRTFRRPIRLLPSHASAAARGPHEKRPRNAHRSYRTHARKR
jgi:hypothetical protein